MNLLSVVIITFNEQENIARCLESVKGIANEVIVLDSFSTDDTVKICKEFGAIVYQEKFRGFGEQKILVNSFAKNDWVLNMDADEELSEMLKKSLILELSDPRYDAYKMNFLTNYAGKWVRHCGWYPAPKVRLWNKTKGTMTADKVHEGWQLTDAQSEVGFLKGDMLHYSYPSISYHYKKIENYAEIGARFDVARGKKCSILKLYFTPFFVFINIFIFRLGFLDGKTGFWVAKNSAFAAYSKYLKIRKYQ